MTNSHVSLTSGFSPRGSDSSGWSTPRLTRNKVVPLSLPLPPTPLEVKQRLLESKTSPVQKPPCEDGETGVGERDAAVVDAAQTTAVVENGVNEAGGSSVAVAPTNSAPSDDTPTDNGPADSASSDGEPVNPVPRRLRRRHTPRSEQPRRDSSQDDKPAMIRKPPRAKSTPVISTKDKENQRPSSQLDWSERQMEVKRTTNDSHTSDACVQTRRESDKRRSRLDRRRARSADLEKIRRSQLMVVDDHWMTEYMRCFSARLR
ncbi:unnamed protein product [Oreochromis niloticus]|nr:unnamed protein product [Mustela putorius furo]